MLNDSYLWIYFSITVALVAKQEDFDVFVAVVEGFRDPEVFDILKRGGLSHVIDHDDTVGAFVVGGGDGSEPLLSGSVPDLELD